MGESQTSDECVFCTFNGASATDLIFVKNRTKFFFLALSFALNGIFHSLDETRCVIICIFVGGTEYTISYGIVVFCVYMFNKIDMLECNQTLIWHISLSTAGFSFSIHFAHVWDGLTSKVSKKEKKQQYYRDKMIIIIIIFMAKHDE